jgi:hypothetical protein
VAANLKERCLSQQAATCEVVFSRLGIKASFDVRTDDARSIQKIIDGEPDAYITSTGKVFQLARAIKNEDRALHLVPVPYDRGLQDLYLPTTLSSEEYPNLLPAGEAINTIATSVLLVSFNWPENTERYNKVARFVDTFFSRIEEFHKPPRHPKWREASISSARSAAPNRSVPAPSSERLSKCGVEAVRSGGPAPGQRLPTRARGSPTARNRSPPAWLPPPVQARSL